MCALVTGVQACALPISVPNTATAARALPRRNAPRAVRFRCPLRALGVNRRSARAVPPGSGRGCARRRGRKACRSFGFSALARGGGGAIPSVVPALRDRGGKRSPLPPPPPTRGPPTFPPFDGEGLPCPSRPGGNFDSQRRVEGSSESDQVE